MSICSAAHQYFELPALPRETGHPWPVRVRPHDGRRRRDPGWRRCCTRPSDPGAQRVRARSTPRSRTVSAQRTRDPGPLQGLHSHTAPQRLQAGHLVPGDLEFLRPKLRRQVGDLKVDAVTTKSQFLVTKFPVIGLSFFGAHRGSEWLLSLGTLCSHVAAVGQPCRSGTLITP